MNQTFKVYFDGGTSKDDNGYGSWEVIWNGFSKKVSRELFEAKRFGRRITNNTAEYMSLLKALEWLQSVSNKEQYSVVISGDSQLVLYTLSGGYKTHKPHLQSLRDQCRNLLVGFDYYNTEWKARKNSVERFGH